MSHLLITVRFLDDRYHGLLDRGGPPEWPPSPFRLFCALVAGVARCGQLDGEVGKALAWLQSLAPPLIVAPDTESGRAITRFVPNNDGDEVADRQHRLAAKTSVPTHFRVSREEKPEVHYLWDIRGIPDPPTERIRDAARSLTSLGWGIDMAFADAKTVCEREVRCLNGTRWHPKPDHVSKVGNLRVPRAIDLGVTTLDDLRRCHQSITARIEHGEPLHVVLKPRVFKCVYYTTQPDNAPRPLAAFEIHRTIDDQEANPGKSRFRPFHHVRRVATVAGIVRHAVAAVARQMDKSVEWVNEYVLGHGDEKDGQATSDERLLFLPLPSIQPVVGVGGIRRVLVVGWPGCEEIASLRRLLNGHELIDRDTCQPVAMLSHVASSDKGVMPFIGPFHTWSTVTPVILPGYDDPDGLRRKHSERVKSGQATVVEQKHLLERLDSRILALIWKAFHQAGWTADALAGAEVEYRKVGWFRGLDVAKNYHLPPLGYPRYHVRVKFRQEVRGPLAVGAGRYRGFGLFARE